LTPLAEPAVGKQLPQAALHSVDILNSQFSTDCRHSNNKINLTKILLCVSQYYHWLSKYVAVIRICFVVNSHST